MAHFSNLSYDKCYLDQNLKQSIGPGNYNLYDGHIINNNSCHSLNGPRNNRTNNSSEVAKTNLAERTDIESILTNREEIASKCSKCKDIEDKKKLIEKSLKFNIDCDNSLNSNHSRLDLPISKFKGLSTIDLQLNFPLTDPSKEVFYGYNTTSLINQNVKRLIR